VRSDLVVVGAGAAGLFAALTAAREGAAVTLVSARPLAETASYWAQGGAAAALAVDDSPQAHLEDTLVAGRGLTRRAAAEVLTNEAPARVKDLVDLGVQFDADRHGDLALGLEGGHSHRRIIHAGGSATGRRMLRALSAAVAEHPKITVLESHRAAAILRNGGVRLTGGEDIAARATILATGGAAALYSRTTNPPGSFGSGLLLARNAGAMLADLEFTQFHPTAVVGLPGREGFLISEAVRGEGATLHGADGERFVDELDPRDTVARAIYAQLQATDARSVGLDMTMVDPGRFPNIVSALQEAGLDPTTERVPVAPASHYFMGGIVTDLDGRATGVERLYAVGEAACTGLHGANRLASNSLSECFVFGRRAALKALDERASGEPRPYDGDPIEAPTRETRRAVWKLAGLERTAAELEQLAGDPYPLARLVAVSALARQETRGSHGRAEFPARDPDLDSMHSLLDAGADVPRFESWPA
jgi:L-aspartate oxidase